MTALSAPTRRCAHPAAADCVAGMADRLHWPGQRTARRARARQADTASSRLIFVIMRMTSPAAPEQ